MLNKSVIKDDSFKKLHDEVSFHLSRFQTSEDRAYYVSNIHKTLAHLGRFRQIRGKEVSLEKYADHYDVYELMHYDLSTVQTVKQLSFTYYIQGEKFRNYSLNRWLELHDHFALHEKFLQQIVSKVGPLLHAHNNEYKHKLKQALGYLYDVVYIRGRHTKMNDLCYPKGPYSKETVDQYDLTTMENMMTLRVECLANKEDSQPVIHRSLNEWMEIALRQNIYNTTKARISEEISQFICDQVHSNDYKNLLDDALELIETIIHIRNHGAHELAQGTPDAPFYFDEVIQYDLSSEESLLALRVHTYHSEGKMRHRSINDLLIQFKHPRIAKSLFNSLYHTIMSEVYRLQELAEKNTTEAPLKRDILWYTSQLSWALKGVYSAIHISCKANIHDESRDIYDFGHIDALLYFTIQLEDGTESSLTEIIGNGAYFSPNLLQTLRGTSVEEALSHAKHNSPVLMQTSMFTSIVIVKKLCALVERGDIEQIKKLSPTAADVNLLIDLPLEIVPKELPSASLAEFWHKLSFVNIKKDLGVITDSIRHAPILLYLGRYNALVLAICFRHYYVVEYFIHSLKADPTIKAGRNGDYSALDCALLQSTVLHIPPPDPRITALLEKPGSRVIKGTFFDTDLATTYVCVNSGQLSPGK